MESRDEIISIVDATVAAYSNSPVWYKTNILKYMQEYSDQQNKALLEEIERLKSELKAAESDNEVLNKSKLEILNEVKFSFDIHSDFSSQCNGYKSLCKQIEHLTNLTQTNKR